VRSPAARSQTTKASAPRLLLVPRSWRAGRSAAARRVDGQKRRGKCSRDRSLVQRAVDAARRPPLQPRGGLKFRGREKALDGGEAPQDRASTSGHPATLTQSGLLARAWAGAPAPRRRACGADPARRSLRGRGAHDRAVARLLAAYGLERQGGHDENYGGRTVETSTMKPGRHPARIHTRRRIG
jgi:hypothetical protein